MATADYNVLYNFVGGSDGETPVAGLALSGNILFGTTQYGGYYYSDGTLFAIYTNGGSYNVLYSFGNNYQGYNPLASLIISGDMLYGTTQYGGLGERARFSLIQVASTPQITYNKLFSFSGITGNVPYSPPVVSSGTLYGTTSRGGTYGDGAVFSANTDGSNYNLLYSFEGNPDGATPESGLILSENTLYGTTTAGGSYNNGIIFSINTDGSGYSVLYTFGSIADDGAEYATAFFSSPNLTLYGNALYGTTYKGGLYGDGTVFTVNTDGSGYNVLYNFGSIANDGTGPITTLIPSGGTLYGATIGGGLSNHGALFSINTNGGGYSVLYSFTASQA